MRRLKSLLAIILFVCSSSIYAQLDKPHFISANFGTSIPLGDYKKADNVASASAESGFSYNIEGALYVNKFIGIGANLGAFNNAVDNGSIVSQLEDDFGASDYNVSADDWINGFFMIGPYFSVGTDKIIVDFKVLGGVMSSKKPLVDVSSNNTIAVPNSIDDVVATSFGVNYGMHVRIKIVSKLGLRLNAEGFSSAQEFKSTVDQIDAAGNTVSQEQNVKTQISALNLGAGLVLTF